MTHIVCRATSCVLWEQGVCTAEEIEYDPDVGCLTFQDMSDLELETEDDDDLDWDAEGDDLFDDEDEDDWDDEDDVWDDERDYDL